ncbi:TonB-dependent receptor [Modicisalibacter xianhensis]|uniref:Iron complex outermembrane recepter protein n=1 Tax=Modicisalibacter xianhensis TaxID=442341 RepID=A0A1I3D559_9GAMM|nr:TonB-dependent receptor [Halomonas xianhensis]SFH81874.1 iron complex outermembrane recepter protein [Halomonas xianhensis]
MKKTFRYGLLVAAGSAAMSAYAQQDQDTMVVVGSRTPTQISQIPGAVWIVEEQEIQQQIHSGQSLKSALGKLIPGFDFGSSTNRTNYAQNFRGRDALVMIDGVSLNNSRSLSRQFDSIDPFNIARIEVLSGASSLYGGGATGGIINIVTKKGDAGGPHFESEVGLTSGLNDSEDLDKRAAQSIAGGNDKVQGRLAVAAQENGWFYDADGDIITPDIAQSGLQGNRSVDVMGNVSIELSETQRLDFTAQYYNSAFEGDKGLYYPAYSTGTTYSEKIQGSEVRDGYESDVDAETDRVYLNANYHNRSFLGQEFYLQAYHRQESSVFHPFPGSSTFTISEQNTDLTGTKAVFTADVSEPFSLTYGIDLSREEFDSKRYTLAVSEGGLDLDQVSVLAPYYPSFEADTFAGFAQADYQLTPQLLLSGGARFERTDVDVAAQSGNDGGENDYDVSLFNAKALYDFENGQQAWLAYTQGFEIPDIAKAYRGVSFDISSNPVDGIKTEQLEAGWRLSNGDWQTQIAAYYSWSDKDIGYLYSDDENIEIGVTTVDKDVRTYGVEGQVQRFVGQNWSFGSNFNWVRSEEKSNGDWIKASVTEASLPTATVFGEWSDLDTRARLQASRAFGIEDEAGYEIDGFTTVDVIASQDTGYGTFSLGVDNLLNEEYTTIWGQRAAVFYEVYGADALWDLQGRGRTYTLTWSHQY